MPVVLELCADLRALSAFSATSPVLKEAPKVAQTDSTHMQPGSKIGEVSQVIGAVVDVQFRKLQENLFQS